MRGINTLRQRIDGETSEYVYAFNDDLSLSF